ncbi:calmodulin-binding-domain-containing protein [Geranomyces variabilis]|nr:calmodulin-binding-domain-containing protein [Geranomyces variabilis]KAJ3141867.1 Enkurin domain-containing protein 1 [Geranomyces variabilis]
MTMAGAAAAATATPPPPTRNSEARRIAVRQMAGTAVAMLLKPSRGVRDDITWAGGKPKDHRRENRMKLKELEKANQAKKEELQKPAPPPFKLKQFEAVPAKLQTRRSNSDSRPSTASSSRSSKNFININAAQARRPPPTPPSPEPPKGGERTTRKGEIPKYLINRKMEWARKEVERLQLIEDNKIPPGMALVPEDERLQTLVAIRARQDELMAALAQFPVIIETMSMKKRKAVIEASLRELEDAEELFSRKKVYVTKENVLPPPPPPPPAAAQQRPLVVDESYSRRQRGGPRTPCGERPLPPSPPRPATPPLAAPTVRPLAPAVLASSPHAATVKPVSTPVPLRGGGAKESPTQTTREQPRGGGGVATNTRDEDEGGEALIPRAAEDPKGETATTATGVAVWDRARSEAERISRAGLANGVAVR